MDNIRGSGVEPNNSHLIAAVVLRLIEVDELKIIEEVPSRVSGITELQMLGVKYRGLNCQTTFKLTKMAIGLPPPPIWGM